MASAITPMVFYPGFPPFLSAMYDSVRDGHQDRVERCEHASGDDGGDSVGRVVESVYELEPDAKKDYKGEKERRVVQLAVFHHDGLDNIGDILAAIDRGLHQRVDVLPFDDLDRVAGSRE